MGPRSRQLELLSRWSKLMSRWPKLIVRQPNWITELDEVMEDLAGVTGTKDKGSPTEVSP